MPAILFDFFGTLVTYSPGRESQDFGRSYELVRSLGCDLEYDAWLRCWSAAAERLDEGAEQSGREFSMHDVFNVFASDVQLNLPPRQVIDRFLEHYLADWSGPVRLVPGVPGLLGAMRSRGYRLVLVTNTHSSAMVYGLLDAMDLRGFFDETITSVEMGYRKPRAEIYHSALRAVDTAARDAIFVGDSLVPDFLGPTCCGIDSYLVSADNTDRPSEVPASRILESVLDLEAVLDR